MGKRAYYVLAVVAIAMLALGVTAWAKTYTFQATSIVPGATGTYPTPRLVAMRSAIRVTPRRGRRGCRRSGRGVRDDRGRRAR